MATDTRENIKAQRRDSKGRVMADTPTLALLKALNDAFQSIRQHQHDVPNVVMVVGQSSKTKHGHFASEAWSAENASGEIMLSGESLQRSAEDVFGTLLHEAAHAAARVRGTKDTSRQGRYHNAQFKKIGEEFGLVLVHDGSIGWSITSVPDATKKAYRSEITAIRKALKTYRIPAVEAVSKPSTNIRVECACGIPVTVPITWWDKHGDNTMTCALCGQDYYPLGTGDPEDDWQEEEN